MTARTDVAAAVNSRLAPIVQYQVDRRGWAMFAALSGRHQRGLSGRDGHQTLGLEDHAGRAFYGVLPAAQYFAGMAPLGQARPYVAATSNLGDERAAGGAFDDAALRIFAERLRRRR